MRLSDAELSLSTRRAVVVSDIGPPRVCYQQ